MEVGGFKQLSSFRHEEVSRVEDQLELCHLEQLRGWFARHRPRSSTSLPGRVRSERRLAGLLTPAEFKEVIAKVLGTRRYDDQLDNLFTKLDSSGDGYVDWNELCSYILLQLREADYLHVRRAAPFEHEPRIRHIVHNRQETTSKIIAVDYPTKFVTVGREGALCVWDTRLHLEKHYTMACHDDSPHAPKRRIREWATDMLYMANCRKIVVASTARDLRFFDITSSQYVEEYLLFALQHVPYCLHYWYDRKNSGNKSFLIYGDDSGALNILYFNLPVVQLFNSPFKKQTSMQRIYFQDLPQHSKWTSHVRLEDIHPRETIRKIIYLPENNCIMSSSTSRRHSLITMDIERKKKTYILRIEKGVECFAYSRLVNIVVTGSMDHMVRVWNPYVTSKPISVFVGHAMSIVDVAIHEQLGQIFSYSRDAVLKVWDVKEQICLQSVYLKFPMSLAGRLPEFGSFSLLLHAGSSGALLLAASDYLALLRIGPVSAASLAVPTTHAAQLCCALYNPHFKQVITGADDSTVAFWDVETGAKSMVFAGAHGGDEITAMTVDAGRRRLITGARNGTINVWNVQTGQKLHKLAAVSETEVTGLFHLPDRKLILAVGWNRLIVQYDDSDADCVHVSANVGWRGGRQHTDDILTGAHCPACNLLATASYDGDINVWSLETQALFKRLRARASGQHTATRRSSHHSASRASRTPTSAGHKAGSRSRGNSGKRLNSRPNSRHRLSHRLEEGRPPPVDKLLFLQARVKTRRMDAAILLSSEAGVLYWWNIYQAQQLGRFYVPDHPDECVLTMATNSDNSILVTADTRGQVALWDITAYCMATQTQACTGRPPLLRAWQAHDAVIVSVEYVDHAAVACVLTGSTDRTARLFSAESGQHIGTFGQKNAWNLKTPETWVSGARRSEESDVTISRDDSQQSQDDAGEVGRYQIEVVADSPVPTIERGDTLVCDERTDRVESEQVAVKLREQPAAATLDRQDTGQLTIATLPGVLETAADRNVAISERHRAVRPTTYTYGSKRTTLEPRWLLGYKAEKCLDQRSLDRQGRRRQLAAVNLQTTRLGVLCCPYQGLATRELKDIHLPRAITTTSRMSGHAHTPAGWTDEYGGSFCLIDTPNVAQFFNDGERRETANTAMTTTTTTTTTRNLPVINKSLTFAEGFHSHHGQRAKKLLTFL